MHKYDQRQYCKLGKVLHVLYTSLHMFHPLSQLLQSTKSVKMVVFLRKRSHNRSALKKYLSRQLNTMVGWLIQASGSQSMGRNPNTTGEGSKNGSSQGDPNLGCIFSTLLLLVIVCV